MAASPGGIVRGGADCASLVGSDWEGNILLLLTTVIAPPPFGQGRGKPGSRPASLLQPSAHHFHYSIIAGAEFFAEFFTDRIR